MFAESESKQLYFRHLGGFLRLQLQKEGVKVVSIKVSSASEPLNGQFTVTLSSGVPTMAQPGTVTDARKSVALKFSSPQDISTQKTFFVPIPAGDYNDLTIELTELFGGKCVKTMQSSHSFHIERGMYSTISLGSDYLDFDLVEGAKGGMFSVSATKKVVFSQGNLQYRSCIAVAGDATHATATDAVGANLGTWRFASNQYDRIFSVNDMYATGSYADTSTTWVDLFRWETSGHNSFYPYIDSATVKESYPNDGTNCTIFNTVNDWGYCNTISNGGDQPGLWRCLTADEFRYLLTSRADAANKWTKATVCGIHGLILLPDYWDCPEGITISISGTSGGYNTNVIVASTWSQLEAAGAIFLPVTGQLAQTTFKVSKVDEGSYWTSQRSKSNPGYYCFKSGTGFTKSETSPKAGFAVRLVHDID